MLYDLKQPSVSRASLSRGDLTEAEWRVLKSLLPLEPANRGRGRRPGQSRTIINGIFWRLKNWRRIATRYDRLAQNFLSAVALFADVIEWLE